MRDTRPNTQAWRFSSISQIAAWKLFVRILLIVTLIVSMLPSAASTVSASTGVTYLDENGVEQTQADVTIIDSNNFEDYSTLSSGWYLFRGSWTKSSPIMVGGGAHIILEDNSDVTVSGTDYDAGIYVSVGSLKIFAQSTGASMGKLEANGNLYSAGIGGSSGTITINGGVITATGGLYSAGIGGSSETITINGGVITATGGQSGGAGIGGGSSETITINGGVITATGGLYSAGIGGSNGTITINSGVITATGSQSGGAGIGGSSETITINGGVITATGRMYSAGIGSSYAITINGGVITATGGQSGGAGIKSSYAITINGGVITATGSQGGAGIGGTIIVSGTYEYWTNTENSAPSAITGRGSFDGDTSTFVGFAYVKLRSVELINSATITVTAPVTGAMPSLAADVGTANFTSETVAWSPAATTFGGNTSYTASVTLTAESGYTFATTLTTATINGNTATVTNNTGTTVTLSYAFAATAAEINSAAITVTAPVTGATPSTTANVGTAKFTAGTVAWSPAATTFGGNTSYTASVTLTAESGYTFATTLTTATINGNTATVTNNTGTTVTLSYAFAAKATPGGGGTWVPPLPPKDSSSQPEPKPEPQPKPTTVDVFNSNILNSASLVEKLDALAAAAEKENTMADFADTHGHWAKPTIDTFLKLQLIQGYEDGTFRPNATITRAEFTTMLSRAFNIQTDISGNVAFKDLDKHWAKDTIVSLAALGVITGYEDGTFMPEQTITREEMIIMLSRIINLNNVAKDTSKGYFTDLNQSYVASEIRTTAQAGIVNGKEKDRFDPKGMATRAEALQIILNALRLDPQVKSLLDSLT
ncbi:S-layer homology domain-containing protein [Paenibacillus sp. Y5S-9]|uniref:S-layer homology domain-containing protein n=1 Tax=Paenibacillus sp. Y5S-9 TaxID=3122489 RepID=UPI0030D37AF3